MRACRTTEGFAANDPPVQHPASGRLDLKLRDDPSVVELVTLPA